MLIHIPGPLRSYTNGARKVSSSGADVSGLLLELDRQYPGMRFRIIDEQDGIRPHMKIFVNASQVRRLDTRLTPDDEIHVICALSGG
jgi:sulfur-carrier protein